MSSGRSDKIRPGITQRRPRTQIRHIVPPEDESGSSSRNKSQSPLRNSRTNKPNRSDPFISSRPKKSNAEDVIGERVKSNVGPLPVGPLPGPTPFRPPKRVEEPKTLSIDQRNLAGPIAAVEFERLKKEVEALKKASIESKKVIKKQNKVIEDLKAELSAVKLEKKGHEAQIQTLQTKNKTNDELITSIEASLQCLICMELLSKPYALSPCGHVLCVGCLQEWFRKAPPGTDDMDVDMQDDADYIMHRAKSCPCCRAVILKRPVPVFVVKAITSSLVKAKGAQREISPSPTDEDPWKGLFPDDDESDQDEYDNDDFWSEDEEGLSEDEIGFIPEPFLYPHFDDYYTDEGASEMGEDDMRTMYDDEEQLSDDEGEDEGENEGPEEYVYPQWAPPAYFVLDMDGHPERAALFRRGCNNELIDLFGILYTHSEGLIAHVNSFDEQDLELGGRFNHRRRRRSNRIMLGYNIDLNSYDGDAEAYMIGIFRDMRENPNRWNIVTRARGFGRDATHLVNVEEVVDYNTTDSESYT